MSRLNRPLGRREWLAAYTIAIAGSIAVAAITVLLVDANLAREANPVTHALAGSSSWGVVLAFKFAVIVPAFQGYRVVADRWHPSVGRAGAWLFAGIVSLNFVNDFSVFLSLGPVFDLDPLLELLPVALIGVLVATAATMRPLDTLRSAAGKTSRRQVGFAIFFVGFMLTAPALPYVSGLSPIGNAEAATEDWETVYSVNTHDVAVSTIDDRVAVGTNDGIEVRDATDGTLVWSDTSLGTYVSGVAYDAANDRVYASGGDGVLYAFDTTGTQVWTVDVVSGSTTATHEVEVDKSNGDAYVTAHDGTARVTSAGSVVWRQSGNGPRGIAIGDTHVYITDFDGTMQKRQKTDGAQVNSVTISSNADQSRAVYFQGYIYHTDDAGNELEKRDTSLTQIWSVSHSSEAHGVGVVDGYVYAGVGANIESYDLNGTAVATYSQPDYRVDSIDATDAYGGTATLFFATVDSSANTAGTAGRITTDDATGVTVSGYVKDSDGNTLSDATVDLTQSGSTLQTTTSAADGSYSFADVVDGDYTIEASKTDYNSGSTSITVSGSAITGANITLSKDSVSGVVTDQYGEPVPNATVEVVAVDGDKITPKTGQTKQERAEELLEQASNPLPGSWNPDLELAGSDGYFENVGSEYVAIHDPEPWGLESWSSGIGDLSNPKLNPAAEEELILSVWNPAKSGAGDQLSPVNRQLPGATVNRDVVIQRLDHKGDVVDTRKVSPDNTRSVGVAGLSAYEHDFARVSLPEGVYRIHPEGASNTAYTVVVGNTDDLRKSFASDLRTKANHLSRAAEAFQSKLNDGTFTRKVVTTDANGRYSVDVGTTITSVAVTAYKIDGDVLTSLSDPSPQDMRAYVVNNDYNGSVYFTVEPRTFTPPTNAGDVTVRKFSSPPYALLDDWVSKWDQWRGMLENETRTDLGSLYQVDLNDWNESDLETGAEDLSTILEKAYENGANDVISQWENDRGEDYETFKNELNDNERTITELRGDIRALEKIIFELKENEEPNYPPQPPTYTNETVSWSMIFGGDFAKEDVVAVWKDHDGTTTTIPDQYIEVDKRAGRGDVARINSYPIPQGSSGGTIDLTVATDDGKIGGGDTNVENPAFEGEVPEIRAIKLSTLKPGSGERVSLEPKIETGGVKLESVEVFDGNGQTVASGVSNGKANFTAGRGTHFVRMTFTDSDGNAFVETMRVPTSSSSFDYPASVAVREGRLGTYALAGDGVNDARVKVGKSGQDVDVTALVDDGSSTSEVHVYLEEAPSTPKQSVTMRVIEGDSIDTGTSLSKRVGLYVHGREIADDTLVYRKGSAVEGGRQPIPASESTKGGERAEGSDGGTVIKTYTGKNGAVTLETNSDPGFGERIRWRFDKWRATTSLPLAITVPIVPTSDVDLIDDVGNELAGIVLESAASIYSTTTPVVGVEA